MRCLIHISLTVYDKVAAGRPGRTGAFYFNQKKEELMKYLMMTLMCFAALALSACGDDEKDTAADTAVESTDSADSSEGSDTGDAGDSEDGGSDE